MFLNRPQRQQACRWLTTIGLACLLLLPACAANADMFGLFAKKYDVHLSPAVSGRLTKDGQPLVGVTIERELHYSEPYRDQATTNSDGQFQFPPRAIQSSLPGTTFGGDTRVIQTLQLHYRGQPFVLWHTSPIGLGENQQLSRRLAQLDCDLASEEAYFYFKARETELQSHTVISICRWPFGPKANDLDDDWLDLHQAAGAQTQ